MDTINNRPSQLDLLRRQAPVSTLEKLLIAMAVSSPPSNKYNSPQVISVYHVWINKKAKATRRSKILPQRNIPPPLLPCVLSAQGSSPTLLRRTLFPFSVFSVTLSPQSLSSCQESV